MKQVMIKSTVIATLWASMAASAWAQSVDDALTVVKASVEVMLSDLKANKSKYAADPSALNQTIDAKVLPYFDADAMARFVLGQSWKDASETQQQDFLTEFKQLIMRSYSSSMLDYADARVDYGEPSPLRKNRTKIPVTVTNAVGERYALELSLRYRQGEWKVYDVALDGLSVVTSYRSSLGEEVAQKGLQQVIDEIKDLNARGAVK